MLTPGVINGYFASLQARVIPSYIMHFTLRVCLYAFTSTCLVHKVTQGPLSLRLLANAYHDLHQSVCSLRWWASVVYPIRISCRPQFLMLV